MAAKLSALRIHPTACVDEPSEIGAGTAIGHFCHVMSGCRIGRRCRLGQNVMVAAGVTIGDRVHIDNNVSVYEGVTLEDDVYCGPSMVFASAHPRGEGKREDEPGTLVERGAILGANATIACGLRIGRHALVGAGAVVVDDVPDHARVLGVPARRRGWACRCGETLPGASDGGELRCVRCGSRYRERDEQLDELEEQAPR